jgi:hypothetical protein
VIFEGTLKYVYLASKGHRNVVFVWSAVGAVWLPRGIQLNLTHSCHMLVLAASLFQFRNIPPTPVSVCSSIYILRSATSRAPAVWESLLPPAVLQQWDGSQVHLILLIINLTSFGLSRLALFMPTLKFQLKSHSIPTRSHCDGATSLPPCASGFCSPFQNEELTKDGLWLLIDQCRIPVLYIVTV